MWMPTHLDQQFARLSDDWSPKVVGRVNDPYVKVARLKGALAWHAHSDGDEVTPLTPSIDEQLR